MGRIIAKVYLTPRQREILDLVKEVMGESDSGTLKVLLVTYASALGIIHNNEVKKVEVISE